MGIAESKVVITTLSRACEGAEAQGRQDLDLTTLCQSQEFVNAAKLIYRHIPAQIRGSKSRAQRAAEGSAPIFLPPVLSPYLKRWRDHPLEFHLPLPGKRTQNNGQDTDSSALVAAFIRCSSFVDSIVVDKVRLRFYYVMFYLLSKEIIPQGTFNSDVEALLSSTIVRSGLVESDKKNVQVKLHDWIDFGERLWLLSDDLGGPGILFLLPDDIPDNTLLKHLHKDPTDDRKRLLDSLRKRGISSLTTKPDAHVVAHGIIQNHLNLLKESLDEDVRRSLDSGPLGAHNFPVPLAKRASGRPFRLGCKRSSASSSDPRYTFFPGRRFTESRSSHDSVDEYPVVDLDNQDDSPVATSISRASLAPLPDDVPIYGQNGTSHQIPQTQNTVFGTSPQSSPSQGRSGSITSSFSDVSPSSHGYTISCRKRRRTNAPEPRSGSNTLPPQNPTRATEPVSESDFSIGRGLPTEFSGSHRAAELLCHQNFAQAFDHPFQPAPGNSIFEDASHEADNLEPALLGGRFAGHGLDDQNYARAFEHPFQPAVGNPMLDNTFHETDNVQLGFHDRYDSRALDDQNYARAFHYPFQAAAGNPMSENTFREADNVQPGFLDSRYAGHGLDDHNYARAFDRSIRFTAVDSTPEKSGREAGGLDFTADSLEHGTSNVHSSRFGAGGIRPTTEPAVPRNPARALSEHCQRIADEIWSYQGTAQSFGTDTIQLIGEPHTAPLVT